MPPCDARLPPSVHPLVLHGPWSPLNALEGTIESPLINIKFNT